MSLSEHSSDQRRTISFWIFSVYKNTVFAVSQYGNEILLCCYYAESTMSYIIIDNYSLRVMHAILVYMRRFYMHSINTFNNNCYLCPYTISTHCRFVVLEMKLYSQTSFIIVYSLLPRSFSQCYFVARG